MYRGTVVNGRKVGAGIFEFACRDVYVGEFSDDAIHGHGVYNFFATEGTYSGQVGGSIMRASLIGHVLRPVAPYDEGVLIEGFTKVFFKKVRGTCRSG